MLTQTAPSIAPSYDQQVSRAKVNGLTTTIFACPGWHATRLLKGSIWLTHLLTIINMLWVKFSADTKICEEKNLGITTTRAVLKCISRRNSPGAT